MTRRNRRNADDPTHTEVHKTPAAYTRATRRSVGHRGGVHVQAMRDFYEVNNVLPRAVRRLMRDPLKAQKRMAEGRAKVNRILAPYGVAL